VISQVIFLFILFLCWGSFLNVVAYRITFNNLFFTKRSLCPSCKTVIAWHDNIPMVSWFILKGRCRACKSPITILYPFIEFLSGILFSVLFFYVPPNISIPEFILYFIFFSALIVSVRTDLEAMVIPQLFSIWLVPVGIVCSLFGFTHISVWESLLGVIFGYGVLWLVAVLFKYFTKKDGLGVGDMELLAMIGAFLGPFGVWVSLLIGSVSGLILGGGYVIVTKQTRYTRIPFGPFLALGAAIYFFFESALLQVIVG